MIEAKVAVYSLLAIIVVCMTYSIISEKRRQRREIFGDRLKALIEIIKNESWSIWDDTPSQRWLFIHRECFLKEIRSKFTDCEQYVSYRVLSEKKLEGCTKIDFPGEYSVEKFLNRLLEGVRKYKELRNKAERDFVLIDAFRGPRDVFLKVDSDECVFLFFDHLNFCTYSEVKVATEEIKKLLAQTELLKEKTVFDLTRLFVEFEGSTVNMEFFTPVGWLLARICREDFKLAFYEAQKS